jgi:hypothetical protein
MPWTLDTALDDDLLTVVDRNDDMEVIRSSLAPFRP